MVNCKVSIPFEGHEYYYNRTDKNVAFVTMDVDWASNEVLEWTFDWFITNEIPVTAFTTHKSEVAMKYQSHRFIEIAIHPNFSRSLTPENKVEELIKMYPNALGSRSHRNIIGRDYTDALNMFQLKYDSSKLLWRAKELEVMPLYNGMLDIPYNWEDGVHLELNETGIINVSDFNFKGLKVLNIHPVLFFLNHRSFPQLKGFTSKYKDLTSVSYEEYLKARVDKEEGMGTYARNLFSALKEKGYLFHKYSDMVIPAHKQLTMELKSNNYWY